MPNDDDYLFFPDITNPKKREGMIEQTLAQSMRNAGIGDKFVYAWHICGFLLTEANEHNFSRKEKRQWGRAIKKYESGKVKMPY